MKSKKKAVRLYERWNNVGARKIVLRADDESHLRKLYAKALEGGLVCDLVKDAGHTEIPRNCDCFRYRASSKISGRCNNR